MALTLYATSCDDSTSLTALAARAMLTGHATARLNELICETGIDADFSTIGSRHSFVMYSWHSFRLVEVLASQDDFTSCRVVEQKPFTMGPAEFGVPLLGGTMRILEVDVTFTTGGTWDIEFQKDVPYLLIGDFCDHDVLVLPHGFVDAYELRQG